MTSNDNSVSFAIEESLGTLLDVMGEWSSAVDVERGVMYDADTFEERAGDPVFLLRQAICDTTIPTNADNGDANRYPGVFSVSNELIQLTHRLNAAKHHFESLAQEARRSGMSRADLRTIYKLSGNPRLHPKHAWRQVIILNPNDLQSIGFSLAKHTASGKVVSQEDMIADLALHNAFDLAQKLSGDHATHYRLHTPIAPHVRANVVWGKKEKRVLQMHYASLPFLIPKGAWPEKRVRFNVPRTHQRRSDFDAHQSIALPYRNGAHITPITDQPNSAH